jgi:hypothetical protein
MAPGLETFIIPPFVERIIVFDGANQPLSVSV